MTHDDSADDRDAALTAVAALGDPLRRKLYRFVSAQDDAVGRDAAAEGVGTTRSAAAFHLDRLVDDGLLEAEFRRLTARRGPGAGRPAKLYRRANREISVNLPARRYDLAAVLLARAVTEAAGTGEAVEAAVDRVARARGTELAATAVAFLGRRSSRTARAHSAATALAAEGYEPRSGPEEIVLGNCPFRAVVAECPQLVCRMNLALLEGFVEALPGSDLTAQLRPSPDHCCVRLTVAPVDQGYPPMV